MTSIKFSERIDYGKVSNSLKAHGLKGEEPSRGERTATLDARIKSSIAKAHVAIGEKKSLDEKLASAGIERAEQRPKAGPRTYTIRVKDMDGDHDVRVFRIRSKDERIPEIPVDDLPTCYVLDGTIPPMSVGSEVTAYATFAPDKNTVLALRREAVAAVSDAELSGSVAAMVKQSFAAVKLAVATYLKTEFSVASKRCEFVRNFAEGDDVDEKGLFGLFSYSAPELSDARLVRMAVVRYIERMGLADDLSRPSLRKVRVSGIQTVKEAVPESAFSDTYVRGVACDVDFVYDGFG